MAGGIAVPPVLGSRATHLISAMGGLDGRALRAGDRLPLGVASGDIRAARWRRPSRSCRCPTATRESAVLPGPQADYFAAGCARRPAVGALQHQPASPTAWDSVSRAARSTHARGADIISDATPLGVLQVPASGQPILLMADRQTAGGYPKIATVISADISLAGQLGPGDAIAFAVCTAREALAALIAQERALMAVEAMNRA